MADHSGDTAGPWARRPAVRDAALAAVLVLAGVPPGDGPPGHPALWWAATGLVAAGVTLRRRWPVPMLGLCSVAAVVHLVVRIPLTAVDLGVAVLLYTVAVRRRRAVSLTALAGMLLLALGSSSFAATQVGPEPSRQFRDLPPAPPPPPPPPPAPVAGLDDRAGEHWSLAWNDQPGLALTLIAAWAIGSGTRSRRAHLGELRARAAGLEREQRHREVLAIAAERGRISRELHDVVAHGLSVMVVQAQGGAAALGNRPADTRAALDAIIRTGRDSLADMRRVLGAVGAVGDAWHPQPGLGALPALLAQVRAAGTPVRLRIHGTPVPLPAPVDLSAYRIVQEALTNTMNHAGPGASAEVVVAYAGSAVRIEVGDDGAGAGPGDGGGNGLRGMRERVRLLGGHVDAGPGPRCGFVVRVTLPAVAGVP